MLYKAIRVIRVQFVGARDRCEFSHRSFAQECDWGLGASRSQVSRSRLRQQGAPFPFSVHAGQVQIVMPLKQQQGKQNVVRDLRGFVNAGALRRRNTR